MKIKSFGITCFSMVFSLLFSMQVFANTDIKETRVNNIYLNKSSITLSVNEAASLTAAINPANAAKGSVEWTSSNLKVAKVNNGIVTGAGEGTAVITAKAADGNYKETCTVTVLPEEIITFKDKGLESAVRDTIEKYNCKLYRRDVADITYLNAANKSISDLSGIENLTGLQHLDLYDNEISNIEPLSALSSLQTLDLNGNKIIDIDALKRLINLTDLDLSYNQISDISALKGLKNLKSVDLFVNSVSDISAFKGLPKLEYLDLKDNKISYFYIKSEKESSILT